MIWQGYQHRNQAIATVFGITEPVHRHVYRLIHGDIDEDVNIIRSCHNTLCINPDHLVDTDHEGMIKHMVESSIKSRSVRSGLSVLSDEDIQIILYKAEDGVPYKEIAEEFNTSRNRVSGIATKHGIRRNKVHAKNKTKI